MRNMRPLFRVLLLLMLSGMGSLSVADDFPFYQKYHSGTYYQHTVLETLVNEKLVSLHENSFSRPSSDKPMYASISGNTYTMYKKTGIADGSAQTVSVLNKTCLPDQVLIDKKSSAGAFLWVVECAAAPPPPPPACLAKAGNEFVLGMLCYVVTCLGDWQLEANGDLSCSGFTDLNAQPIPSPISQSGCKAIFQGYQGGAQGQLREGTTGIPPTNQASGFCNVVYKYTGEPEGPSAPPPPVGAENPLTGSPISQSPDTGTPAANTGTPGTGATTSGAGAAPGAAGTPCVATPTNPCNGTGIGGEGGSCDPATQTCGSSYGSGTCADKPKCSGDPVLCGIIHQNWVDTCALMKMPTTEEKQAVTAQQATYQEDYERRSAAYGHEVKSYFAGFQGSATGTQYQGQCPQDKTFSAMNRTFTFQLSQYCDYFRIFRFFVLAFAYLAAARTIFASV